MIPQHYCACSKCQDFQAYEANNLNLCCYIIIQTGDGMYSVSISLSFFSASELSSLWPLPTLSTGPFCLQLLFQGLHFGFGDCGDACVHDI